jgi:hypothetical protein
MLLRILERSPIVAFEKYERSRRIDGGAAEAIFVHTTGILDWISGLLYRNAVAPRLWVLNQLVSADAGCSKCQKDNQQSETRRQLV